MKDTKISLTSVLKKTISGSGPAYSRLNNSPPSTLHDADLKGQPDNRKLRSCFWWIVLALVQGILNVVFLVYLVTLDSRASFRRNIGTYEDGFRTELNQSLRGLELEDKVFTGGLVYNESKYLVVEHEPDDPVWVGEPTREMDALWQKIEDVSVVYLDGGDADFVRERTTFRNGYWLTGLDVFHQLHCLNRIRKALYPQHYPAQQSERVERLHNGHCLDYVRQAVMCNADVIPVLNRWEPNIKIFTPEFGTRHTCRDFNGIFEWAKARSHMRGVGKESEPRDRSLIVTSDSQYAHAHGGNGGHV